MQLSEALLLIKLLNEENGQTQAGEDGCIWRETFVWSGQEWIIETGLRKLFTTRKRDPIFFEDVFEPSIFLFSVCSVRRIRKACCCSCYAVACHDARCGSK